MISNFSLVTSNFYCFFVCFKSFIIAGEFLFIYHRKNKPFCEGTCFTWMRLWTFWKAGLAKLELLDQLADSWLLKSGFVATASLRKSGTGEGSDESAENGPVAKDRQKEEEELSEHSRDRW